MWELQCGSYNIEVSAWELRHESSRQKRGKTRLASINGNGFPLDRWMNGQTVGKDVWEGNKGL